MESFYDIGTGDLKDLWDSDLDPAMQEAFKMSAVDSDMSAWFLERDVKPHHQVVLHDRLMTDAALGTPGTFPIKSEHSYCSLQGTSSDCDSMMDGSLGPESPMSLRNKMDDMEDECFPAISMNSATASRDDVESPITVKEEPASESESLDSSCPASPEASMDYANATEIILDHKTGSIQLSHNPQSLLKPSSTLLLSPNSRSAALFGQTAQSLHNRFAVPKFSIKVEHGSTFGLPPTPPSSTNSDDSEGNLSPEHNPASPGRRASTTTTNSRLFSNGTSVLTSPGTVSTRQPINTPLISTQPKGSTGVLMLTEEEKRTLHAEGYPIPTRLPLTKAEEKSLKKIRRKIKNKISAQESRRKKKEYMDQLERKVEILVSENCDYRKRVESLEDSNNNLLSQLAKLQALVNRQHRK